MKKKIKIKELKNEVVKVAVYRRKGKKEQDK